MMYRTRENSQDLEKIQIIYNMRKFIPKILCEDYKANTTVGDTVYIYVGEKYKSIMFKCEVIAADQHGNRSTDDYPYYKDLAKDPDARYMKLKLVEKYPVGQYPLKELKENGLTSVQGRSKATIQLMKYLEK